MRSISFRLRRKQTVKIDLADTFALVVLGTEAVYVFHNGETITLRPSHNDQAHIDMPHYTVDLDTRWVGGAVVAGEAGPSWL